jgi:Leucine-rich repeat (LRR) protein
MIKVYFVCQNPITKQKVTGDPLYYNELNEHVHAQIQANYMNLLINLPGWTVLSVIGNMEIV